ncbi:GNAT family N-acetyltransferase [Parasphingopyxis sp.]|uniref:GNAT family N-acetyltransferase n=1 Tax=Parasphingopyxis sp. TaxID=1920299 RepID=UPI00261FA832|nr:GNAT family N-acetyltransferase [Parasphingopyxis sp.]
MLLQHVNRNGYRDVRISDGADADIDTLASASPPARRFLRAGWFRAASPNLQILSAERPDGSPILALPYGHRRIGPLRLREVAGGYWPFRSFALSSDASMTELKAVLENKQTAKELGRIWRLGPVYSDDPTARRLLKAAPEAGWNVIQRPTARVYELDLQAQRQDGPWPRTKTLRKNRWRERRLASDGEVRYEFLTGRDLTAECCDAMAEIEKNSWLADLNDGGDTKFLNPAIREVWQRIAADDDLAPMLFGSLMWIGDRPAAFAFGVEAGDTRYYIANNYDAHFSKFGPGKLLLYADFERAADAGIRLISWGAGDAGYKSEMGAEPGPEISDLFFVRGRPLAALLRPLLMRGAHHDEETRS